ncbi:MAG TPA: hypothetical protein VF624_13800 [Tepidisphaeraceae bacterium]|jgi:hypothetical protein
MSNSAILLQIKRAAGLATPTELAALDEMPVITGNGLVTPRPSADVAAWAARYGGERLLQAFVPPDAADGYPAEANASRPIEKDADGFIQCAPGEEPGHPDKPRTFRPTDLTQPQPLTLRERYIRDVRRG